MYAALVCLVFGLAIFHWNIGEWLFTSQDEEGYPE